MPKLHARHETKVRQRRPPPPRGHWWLSMATLACIASAAFTLLPLLRGTQWWFQMVFCAAAVLLSMGTLRQLRSPRRLTVIGGAGVLIVIMTATFAGESAFLGMFPTLDTLGALGLRNDEGWNSIVVQSVPATVGDGLAFLLVGGAGLLALTLDVCVQIVRAPALAAVPLLAIVTIPGLFLDDGAELPALLLLGAAYLMLLRVDVRMRRTESTRDVRPVWGAVVLGVGALCAALVVATLNPTFTTASSTASRPTVSLFGSGVNAMTTLGEDLRRPLESPALQYSSTSARPLYLGMLILDSFDGDNWVPSALPVDTGNTVAELSLPEGLSDSVPRSAIETSVVITGVRSNWLPIPAATTSVDGLKGNWFWEKNTRAVASFTALTAGQSYTVSSLQLGATAETLRTVSRQVPEGLLPMLELPADRPAIIDDTVASVTAGLDNPWDIAVALQGYFRSNDFRYSESAPVDEGYDGDGLDVTAAFLQEKAGYCVHFASTMTMMARIAGIPARVAVGYQPGKRTSMEKQGNAVFAVSSNDLHAWPELYFDGFGWVAFEPTPSRGTVPTYSLRSSLAESTPSTTAPSVPSSSPTPPGANAGRPDINLGGGSGATAETGNTDALRTIGLSLAALLLLLMPMFVRQIRRRARLSALIRGAGIEPAWRELTDAAIDHGLPVRETETPRVLATRVRERIAASNANSDGGPRTDALAALDALLEAVERSRFAAHDPAHAEAPKGAPTKQLETQLRIVYSALRAAQAPVDRLWSTLAPRSLWVLVRARAGWGASEA